MMIVADYNQISYEEAFEKSCKTIDYAYYESFTLQRRCSYCQLLNCFVRIVKFLFLTIDSECILAHNRLFKKMNSLLYDLLVVSIAVICLKTYCRQQRKKVLDKSVNNLINSIQVALKDKKLIILIVIYQNILPRKKDLF